MKKVVCLLSLLFVTSVANAGPVVLYDNASVPIGTATNPLKVTCVGDCGGGSSQWSDGASSAIYYNDGNVGIGTSAPTNGLHVTNSGRFVGAYTENTTNTGVHLGYFGGNPRVGLFTGTASQNWQIDNNGGVFRFYTPGSTALELSTTYIRSYRPIGIGTSAPSARLHTIATTEQLRLGYDTSNYVSTTVESTGIVTHDAVGSGASFVFSDPVKVTGATTLIGATNNCILTVDADATCDAGTKIGEDNSIAICAVCAAN
jgi:hypothetical protein